MMKVKPAWQSQPENCAVVLGIGLRAQTQAQALHTLWQQAQACMLTQELAVHQVLAIAVLQTKATHAALRQWLPMLGLTAEHIVPVPRQALSAQPVHTQSARLLARYGTGSVAEAAALWAAGAGAQLLLPRCIAADGSATLAAALPAHCAATQTGTGGQEPADLPANFFTTLFTTRHHHPQGNKA